MRAKEHDKRLLSRTGISNLEELAFATRIEAEGKTWIHLPRRFPLRSLGSGYTPDFYVIEDNTFYEICGTRQAYSYARVKVEAFRREYPKFKLVVINAGAWVDGPQTPRVVEPKRTGGQRSPGRCFRRFVRRARRDNNTDALQLLTLAKRLGFLSVNQIAISAGVMPTYLGPGIKSTQGPKREREAVATALAHLAALAAAPSGSP